MPRTFCAVRLSPYLPLNSGSRFSAKARGPAVAVQLAKRLVYRGLNSDALEALEAAGQAMAIVQSTEDSREGPRAFAESRPPKFTGR